MPVIAQIIVALALVVIVIEFYLTFQRKAEQKIINRLQQQHGE